MTRIIAPPVSAAADTRYLWSMSLGVVLALVLVVAMSAVYSGGIWLLTAWCAPAAARARFIERTVRRETADLDRKIVEMTRRMHRFD